MTQNVSIVDMCSEFRLNLERANIFSQLLAMSPNLITVTVRSIIELSCFERLLTVSRVSLEYWAVRQVYIGRALVIYF